MDKISKYNLKRKELPEFGLSKVILDLYTGKVLSEEHAFCYETELEIYDKKEDKRYGR